MWSDGIYSLQKKKEKDPTMLHWKVGSLTAVSFSQCINLITLLFWINQAGIPISVFVKMNVSDMAIINKFLSFLIWLLPFYIINYFMIIHKKKYENILLKYPPENEKGWSMILYFILSLVLFLLPIFICSKVLNVL